MAALHTREAAIFGRIYWGGAFLRKFFCFQEVLRFGQGVDIFLIPQFHETTTILKISTRNLKNEIS